ncbi:glycosyltransferase family 4 protein [Domibacillus aminovorans]|uniref:Glycosyltransferase subfamily 4-like N-terminal domain-containing protein n=1 Tax=Domibacillus aminovorans TaxID=29332 RepID=A0A177L0S3_9BACI|nr:glycosyltransferase family 4 protein [Domibacillus aminovorans]OAH58964.1 hypothetical protein AWH49_04685 [Domibacillus aminovorans]
MKIVMLISSFYPLMGGAEVQVRRLSNHLIKKGHQVTIVTRWHEGLKTRENIDEIEIIRLKVSKNSKIAPLIYLYKSLVYIGKNKKNIDILHSHSLRSTALSAAFGKLLFNIPAISKIAGGGNELGCEAKRLYHQNIVGKARINFLTHYLDAYISISKAIKKDLQEINVPTHKIKFIPNGINIDLKSKNSDDKPLELLEVESRKNLFLFAGRFEKIKGLDVLLQAWKNTSPEFKDNNQLILLGEGKMDIQPFLNDPSILLIGRVDNVSSYMKYSDFFLLPSRYEGISNALLEAVVHKLYVIATPVGGTTDIIDESKGMIIEKENATKLSEGLHLASKLKDEQRKETTDSAFSYVKEYYDFLNVTKEYEKLYSNLINKKL